MINVITKGRDVAKHVMLML